jgi:hypothetical protein
MLKGSFMQTLSHYQKSLSMAEDKNTFKKMKQQIQPFKGIRGVPYATIAQLLDEDPSVDIESQSEELHSLFMGSFEEGLIAVGLLSVASLTHPSDSWELAQKWLTMVDDIITTDALGKIVIGPCALQLNIDIPKELQINNKVYSQRALLMSLCSFVPESPKGPWVSALRSHLQSEQVIFVDKPMTHHYQSLFPYFLKEEQPQLRKSIIYLIQLWSSHDLPSLDKIIEKHPQNLPKWLKKGYEKGRKLYLKKNNNTQKT